jgi:hypothetical protein
MAFLIPASISIDCDEPPDSALELLRACLRPWSVSALLDHVSGREYAGDVSAQSIRVQPVGPTSTSGQPVWHLMTPIFDGRLVPAGSGSRLEGAIRLNRAILVVGGVLLIVLLGWLAAGAQTAVERLIAGRPIGQSLAFAGLAMPTLFLVALLGFYGIGYRLSLRDRAALIEFLVDAVKGRRSSP